MCDRFKIYHAPAKQVAQVKNIKLFRRKNYVPSILKYNSVKSMTNFRIALHII